MTDDICWESCCSKDEALCSDVFFTDNSEFYGCSETNKKQLFDVLQVATIDDFWNVHGDKSLSEPWIGLTRFALRNTNPPDGCMWVQGRLTKDLVTTRPGHMWPEESSNMLKRATP